MYARGTSEIIYTLQIIAFTIIISVAEAHLRKQI
jgi:hypothetical protein